MISKANIGTRKSLLLHCSAGFIILIASLMLLELMSAIYFAFPSRHFYRPVYLRNDSVLAWRTEYEAWGAWHKPNATAFHQSPCFAVSYTSNSVGARDVERASPGAPNSLLFLGDSFIEGYGVKDDDRLSNIIQRRTGRASINLAAAGNLGPLQYLKLYEAFANRYAHDGLVIGLLPYNDFTDNDPDYSDWKNSERYRPYYKRTETGYEIFYKGTFEPGRTFSTGRQILAGGKIALLHYTWTGGLLFEIEGQLPARRIDISRDMSTTGYFETSRERLEAAFFFLEEIVRRASEAKVYILIIPNYSESLELRMRQSPWISEFMSRFKHERIAILDLGPIFSSMSDDELRSAFLDCDGH